MDVSYHMELDGMIYLAINLTGACLGVMSVPPTVVRSQAPIPGFKIISMEKVQNRPKNSRSLDWRQLKTVVRSSSHTDSASG